MENVSFFAIENQVYMLVVVVFYDILGKHLNTKVERNQNHVKNFVGERLTLSYGLYEERTFPPLHYLLLVSGERCGVGEGLCAV